MWPIYITMAAVFLVAGCPSSRPSPTTKVPVRELTWSEDTFRECEQTKDGFFGLSTGKLTLQMWRWEGATVKRCDDVAMPDVTDVIPLPRGEYLASIITNPHYGPWPLAIASLGTNDIIRKWDTAKGWGYSHVGVSRNGKYVALILREGSGEFAPPDHDWENPRYRIGLSDVTSRELSWVAELKGGGGLAMRKIAVSDDGKSIAAGGWNNKVALADASLKRIVWIEEPGGKGTCGYVAFSSDGSTLYAADYSAGGVYALETKTGKVLRQWCATRTGEDIYGQRISCLAVSPDDAWVAVGTGPAGEVFLFSTTSPSGSKPIFLPHGLNKTLIVSFSPDSTRLASVGGGKIKIWEVPAPSKIASSSSRPAGN